MFRNQNRFARGQGGAAGSVGQWPPPHQAGTGAEAGKQDQGCEVPGVLRAYSERTQTGMGDIVEFPFDLIKQHS